MVEKTKEPAAPKAATIKARVIADHGNHRINDVIEVPEHARAAWFDTNAAAVAYALGGAAE